MKRNQGVILLTAIYGLLLFLSFNRHSRSGYFNYHSEIWADKAGYYAYLPAAFKYKFDAYRFPPEIDQKTGNGFHLDSNGKVRTKYTYGVALMQTPFFLLADALAPLLNMPRDGFSPIYHWSINVAACTYCVIGLFFLFLLTRNYVRVGRAVAITSVVLLGTNLFYYTIDESGMSHVYSFALFSLLLYQLKRAKNATPVSSIHIFLIALTSAVLILIRPTNLVFVVCAHFLQFDGDKVQPIYLGKLFQWIKPFLVAVVALCLVFGPQLAYWHYLSGSISYYPYQGEGFNFLKPQILQTLFAPNNGLFPYVPLFIIPIFGLIVTIETTNSKLILFCFILHTYVLSSWWDPAFGCSFGARNFVDILPFIAFATFQINWKRTRLFSNMAVLIASFCVLLNIQMTYSFDGCFGSAQIWDWSTYRLYFLPD